MTEPTFNRAPDEIMNIVEQLLAFTEAGAKANLKAQGEEHEEGAWQQISIASALQLVTGAANDRTNMEACDLVVAYGIALGSVVTDDSPDNVYGILEAHGEAYLAAVSAINAARRAGLTNPN